MQETNSKDQLPHNCCGPGEPQPAGRQGEPTITWNTFSHKEALTWAVNILKPELSSEAAEFQKIWSFPNFKANVEQGLYDADYEEPWAGRLIYQNHFYDPDTGRNFWKNEWTALCDGQRYFYLSVHAARRVIQSGSQPPELVKAAAFNLGLSLHYLSDLTQPMHAANFANYLGWHRPGSDEADPNESPQAAATSSEPGDGNQDQWGIFDERHAAFEKAGDIWVKNRYRDYYAANPLKPEDVDVTSVDDPGSILRHTARVAKAVFAEYVAPRLREKERMGRTFPEFNNFWSQEEAQYSFIMSLLAVPKVIARYLAFWTRCVRSEPRVSHTQWYQLRVGDRPVRRIDGEFRVGEPGERSYESQFCLVFNADGTWTVVCRAKLAKVWHMSRPIGSAWVVESDYPPGTPHADSRFQFVSAGPGAKAGSFWIFEPTKARDRDPEVVALNLRSGPGLRRWLPDHEPSHLFRLIPIETINAPDQNAVRANWPDWGKYKWWGA